MEFCELDIKDILLIKPDLHKDERGYLYESFNKSFFNKYIKSDISFIQDIHSYSRCNVIRGLHYQLAPKAQAKLVRVIKGDIFNVAVDLRKNSPSFGCWVGQVLSKKNRFQMWIPEGFANGFLVLTNDAEIIYKVTEKYSPQFERCILWNDNILGIKWPLNNKPIISQRDALGVSFHNAEVYI
jgi:dTDP-4-dehydrorhamnose 3,5-epimerase